MANSSGYSSFSDRFSNRRSKSNVLECRVCEDAFALQGDKTPRLLQCGHSLCHNCLLNMPVAPQDKILCPFDRKPTEIGLGGIQGLSKNFALLELIERLQYDQDRLPLSPTSDLFFTENKEEIACDEDESHTAVVFCLICSSHLCVECSERTHATRTLTKHRRVPLSEKPKKNPKCVHHPSRRVEFACLEDGCQSAPLMCFICKDYGRHQKHKHTLLEAEADNIRSTVIPAIQHMRKFIDDIAQANKRLDEVISCLEGGGSVAGAAELARARVRGYFHELREQLSLQETCALTVVDTHVREKLCFLRHQQEELTSLSKQVNTVCVQCHHCVQQPDARVLLTAPEVKSLLSSIDKQQQQFTDLLASFSANEFDTLIPITFTKDNRVHIGPKLEMRVVTLGLDNAGKTSILFKLKQNEFMPTLPTIGFNVETVEFRNLKFTVWDVGGQPKLRPLWKHYYLNTQAIIFVIDSSDHSRLQEAHSELAKLMAEKELKDASLLIFANKQDMSGCLTLEDITHELSLCKLCCGRSWHIQASDAQSGTGLHDGLDWLARQLLAVPGPPDTTQ